MKKFLRSNPRAIRIGILIPILAWIMLACVDETKETPVAIFTNSEGIAVQAYGPMETVYASFSSLLPNTRYDIKVVQSNGKEISNSSLQSDTRGIIPTIALWWEVGVTYNKSKVGKLDFPALSKGNYTCRLLKGKRRVAEFPIQLSSEKVNRPFIFSSTPEGDPTNAFKQKAEGVFVSGRNFPPGALLQIHVVRDRYSWNLGDQMDPEPIRTIKYRLDDGQRDFTTAIWPVAETESGTYDLVVEYDGIIGRYDRNDLIDDLIAGGFVVYSPIPPVNHIEEEVACQAPPQDNYGNVIGAPNPVYKNTFAPVEEVWAAVNPTSGGGNYAGQNARLYIVDHLPASGWTDGKTLSDISSDGYEAIIVQPGCANVNYTRIESSPSTGNYDVVVDFAPFGKYNRGQDIIDALNPVGFLVPTDWIALESVSFNHNTSSNSSDAINIRMNRTEDVLVPEWQKNKKNYPAAYIHNSSLTVKAVFSAGTGVSSANIRAGVHYGNLGAVSSKTVSFSGGTSGSVSFTISGATPNDVRYFYQKWKWYASDVNGSGSAEVHLGDSKNKIFVVLAQPPAPWTTSGQSEPWAEVLTKSCYWAIGETTILGAAEEVQHHVYEDLGGSYVYWDQYSGPTTQDFEMTNFLSNIPVIGQVNCYDMGKTVVSFSNVLGCNLVYNYSSPFGQLNCEKAVGKPWYCEESFGNHAFGAFPSGNVIDACLTIDSDSNPNAPPHTNFWLTNIPWNTYNQMVVENATAGTPAQYNFDVQ
jgi:hypothetical protein